MSRPTIYTSTVSYGGEHKIDITKKTGVLAFSPTWEIILKFKAGKMTKEEYAKEYLTLMLFKQILLKHEWEETLQQPRIVLCCYCSPGTFCHRVLLALELQRLGATYVGENCPRCTRIAKIDFAQMRLKCECGWKGEDYPQNSMRRN